MISYDKATPQIHQQCKINQLPGQLHIGNVTHPNLVYTCQPPVFQQIGERVPGRTLCRLKSGYTFFYPKATLHAEPFKTIAANPVWLNQFIQQPGRHTGMPLFPGPYHRKQLYLLFVYLQHAFSSLIKSLLAGPQRTVQCIQAKSYFLLMFPEPVKGAEPNFFLMSIW